jgi:hypothetical protein
MSSCVEKVLQLAAPSTTPTKPYGEVTYADPGYQADKQKRYPLNSEKRIRAALSYIAHADNAAKYSKAQLALVVARIRAAARKMGIKLAD